MKLTAPNDPHAFRALNAWADVEPWKNYVTPQTVPPEKASLCRSLSALFLLRLLRAFEKRSSPPPAGSSGAAGAATHRPPVARSLPSLSDMMKKSVKVTSEVRESIEFMGSDMLRLLQVIPMAPTLADVTACSIKLLSAAQDHRLKDLYLAFFSVNYANDPHRPTALADPAEPTKFGVFALQALLAIQTQVLSTYEIAYDHDCIFDTAYSTIPSFKSSIETLGKMGLGPPGAHSMSTMSPDTEARDVSWKMARFLSLMQDFSSDSSEEDVRRSQMWSRRNHIVDCASAIAFALELGQLAQQVQTGTVPDPQGQRDHTNDIARATAPLMSFLAANTERKGQSIAVVTRDEIRSTLTKVRTLILALPLIPKNSPWFQFGPSVPFWGLPLEVQRYIMQNYSHLITELISKGIKQEIMFSTAPESSRPSRTALSRCLFLFPMVMGEHWGIHRDSPVVTSKQFCTGSSRRVSQSSSDSVALVMKVKSNRPPVSPIKKRQSLSQSPESEPAAKRAKQSSQPPQRGQLQSSQRREPSTQRIQQQSGNKRNDSPPKRSEPSTKQSTAATLHINKQPPAKPRPPKVVKMSDVDPPVVNEAMELNEWTLSVLSLSVIKPSDTLLTFLGEHDRRRGDSMTCLHEVIVPVLNRGISRISRSLQVAHSSNAPNTSGQVFVGKRDGRVYVNGVVNEDIQLCASVVGFFYHSLEAIMNDQLKRLEFLGPFNALMQSESFHRALLAICYACILKGVGATQRLRVDGSYKDCTVFLLLETIESNPYTFLKVTEALRRALVATDDESRRVSSSPLIPRLPTMLHQYVQKIEVQLLESVIWARSMSSTKSEPTLMITVKSIQSLPGSWPPDVLAPILPEELTDVSSEPAKIGEVRFKPTFSASSEANFLTYILRKLLKLSMNRIQKIFGGLNLSSDTIVHTQAYVAFRYCLRNHIDMLFERHVDQLLLCTIYGICKVMSIKSPGSQHVVTFGQIIDAYCQVRGTEQGQRTCRVIVRHVKLASSDDEIRPKGQFFGAIIDFYNQVYIPKMQRHFLRSESLRQSIAEYSRTARILKEQRQGGTQRSKTSNKAHASGRNSSKGTAAGRSNVVGTA
eukprot:CAMPEP_0113511726 /NCGR_PEP_ID=MMETSP0014_2-20120614/38905_1 /TAXON_ID=2857 /ORGANISM="Nitzschia sp." /LENGTH=1092 /DNA_ID=CAMNT_0000407927 /DNA_START=1 /DNA_END=3276 /DNA_ORIENTATION=+ /assembly_acc=CAM_ASM_000159